MDACDVWTEVLWNHLAPQAWPEGGDLLLDTVHIKRAVGRVGTGEPGQRLPRDAFGNVMRDPGDEQTEQQPGPLPTYEIADGPGVEDVDVDGEPAGVTGGRRPAVHGERLPGGEMLYEVIGAYGYPAGSSRGNLWSLAAYHRPAAIDFAS